MKAEIIDFKTADWKRLDNFEDRTVFQTREWVDFVGETQRAPRGVDEPRESARLSADLTAVSCGRIGGKCMGGCLPGRGGSCMGCNPVPGGSSPGGFAAKR